jgi:response regulator RpfG family c-di-GMP phosphodiesterase
MRNLILIIDDEFIILESLRIQLERFLPEDVEVEAAYSGEEAVELLGDIAAAGWNLLVVVSDYNLGDAKGTEVLIKVKEMFPLTRRILLSGQAGSDEEIEAFIKETSLDLFLSKPWDLAELRSKIETYLGERT